MNELIHDLMRIGLTQNEAQVYCALLQLGGSTVNPIAVRATVNRATTYGVLDALVAQGLVMVEKRGSERWYAAEPPERLVTRFQVKLEELEELKRIAKRVMPHLRAVYRRETSCPKIRYIESYEGLRSMQLEYERRATDIIQLVGYDAFLALHDPAVSKEHLAELNIRKVRIRAMLITDRQIDPPEREGVEICIIPTSVADIQGEITVADDVLIQFSYDDGLIAIEIDSPVIAKTARVALEMAWNEAKRLTR